MSANKPETIKKLRKVLRKYVQQRQLESIGWYHRAAMYSYSTEKGNINSVNYYCHGNVANGNGITGLVEHLQEYSARHGTTYPGFKEAFKAYVGYILNRHPLSSVALDKSAYRAIRYGLPVDVTKTNFEVRAFLMSLRRGKELPAACVIWKKLVDSGIDENVAFMVISSFELGCTVPTNGIVHLYSYYFSGNSDHSLLSPYGDWKETFLFFKKPFVPSKNAKSFNQTVSISPIKRKVAFFHHSSLGELSMYGLVNSVGGIRHSGEGDVWESLLEVVKKIETKFKELN